MEFKFALKIISLDKFFNSPCDKKGNYQEDDRDFAVDFLGQPVILPRDPHPDLQLEDIKISEVDCQEDLSKAELNSLFHLVGYCVHSIKKNETVCDTCLQDVACSKDIANLILVSRCHHATTLTNLREFKKDSLEHVKDRTFSMMLKVEMMFRSLSKNLLMTTENIKAVLVPKAGNLTAEGKYPACHQIKQKLLNK